MSIRAFMICIALVLSVSSYAQQTPYAGTIAIPGTLQAENYDVGGNGVAWFDTTVGNVFGVYRTTDMDVGTIPVASGGGNHIGGLEAGEWAEYSVNVATAGTYDVTVRWASDYAGTTSFRLLQGTTVLTTQNVTKTSSVAGDWHTYQTRTFPVTLTAGASILRIEFTTGFWNFDWLSFVAQTTCAAPVFTAALPGSTTFNEPGQTWTLTAQVTNPTTTTYQWYKDGGILLGKTNQVFSIAAEQGDVGYYTVKATSSCGASATSNQAQLFRVKCSASPGNNSENIYRALSGKKDYCYWQEDKNDGFPFIGTDTNGSYNKAVVSAAVAYIKGDSAYPKWWKDYLRGELNEVGAPPNWFYGGQELGSFTYQHFNMISVLAVAYHADFQNDTALRDMAWRWLRNTFTLHALSAVPSSMLTKHCQGQQRSGTAYTGPFIAMAGERSSYINWDSNDRSIMFSQAVGFSHNGRGETPGIKNTREFIESHWTKTGQNAYGLSSSQRNTLRGIVNSGTIPSDLVGSYLSTTLRTKMRYNIVGWQNPEIVRLTLMEENKHTFTAPTFGVVYFTNPRLASGREAHFLWPWSGLWANENYKKDVTHGTGVLNLTAAVPWVEASQPGSSYHPARSDTISPLPSGASRAYWIVLSPTAAPAVQ